MTPKPLPPLELLDEWLNYDPETGVFTWRKNRRQIIAGAVAGYAGDEGYRRIRIDRRLYRANRLAFYLYYRREPIGEVDHRDGNKDNNRIGNLRDSSPAQNSRNTKIRSTNTSGVKGACWTRGRWHAKLTVNYRQIHLGCFRTLEEAATAIRSARERLHGSFARHN